MTNEHTVYIWSDGTTAGVNVAIPSLGEQFYIPDSRLALAEAAKRLGIAIEEVQQRQGPPPNQS